MAITVQELVQREVHYCVSSLVHTLAQGYGAPHLNRDLETLAEQAFELSSPIDDWEEAAREAGYSEHVDGFINGGKPCWKSDKLTPVYCATAQDACEANDIEPYQWEVYEHWIVSDWLADKLIAKGEKVDKDFGGMTVWARTTTGQAIYMDNVMERITADLNGKPAS
ncbi:hypothetical protein [Neorhizobium sp. S3-V5DH]|uniref:hypothetical protein n=1 Tax=Neorhizobium sp. S3-V5DH TaxID=2485166 RepID=UPI001050A0F4|nr:hypothetical protein [Neorhizobium sp. S3-V5DH]TCV62294.1 hypothetical protein EDE09_12458 [Neorhizobium sp. S3-V5DH]